MPEISIPLSKVVEPKTVSRIRFELFSVKRKALLVSMFPSTMVLSSILLFKSLHCRAERKGFVAFVLELVGELGQVTILAVWVVVQFGLKVNLP